jgi:hypothetical protein
LRVNSWGSALIVFGLALLAYSATVFLAHINHPPTYGYFNYLAESFLQGRTYLTTPPTTYDLTYHAGNWYVPFPPLPALLMLPWVAWFGAANTNVLYFSVLIGSLNVSLMYLFLEALARRGWTQLHRQDNLWLTLLFGLGTVHWSLAVMGEVWFVSQVCTVTFVLLAAWLAVVTKSPWWSGAMLALAVCGRPTVALSWILLVGIAAQHLQIEGQPAQRGKLIKWAASAALPVGLGLLALLGYNWLRFGNLTDFGYGQENVSGTLTDTLHQQGQFNLSYLPTNLRVMLLALPDINLATRQILPDPEGMSIFLTTPALLYLVRLFGGTFSRLGWGSLIALLALLAPLLTYYNTGWVQFGYRFSLDFIVPLMTLMALAVNKNKNKAPGEVKSTWLLIVLISASVLINGWGTDWFIATQFH